MVKCSYSSCLIRTKDAIRRKEFCLGQKIFSTKEWLNVFFFNVTKYVRRILLWALTKEAASGRNWHSCQRQEIERPVTLAVQRIWRRPMKTTFWLFMTTGAASCLWVAWAWSCAPRREAGRRTEPPGRWCWGRTGTWRRAATPPAPSSGCILCGKRSWRSVYSSTKMRIPSGVTLLKKTE